MMYLATNRILLEAMCGHVETMGGRRSRYWCGLCSGRETKPVVPPDDYQAGGAPRIAYLKEKTRTRQTMAAKNTLKYKRNKLPPLLDIVNDLLEVCLRTIRSPDFKGTLSDLIRLIRLRLKLEPPQTPKTTAIWIDKPVPA